MKHFIASLTITLAIIATIAFSAPVSAAGVNSNPWGYDFTAAHGSLITSPAVGFCGQYFHCISNFPNGNSTTAPSLPLTGSDPYVVLHVH